MLDADGDIGLDAAVMEGSGLRGGGVLGVQRIANPVLAAAAVLAEGRHVLLAGVGAERFAEAAGLHPVEPERHITAFRREQLARVLQDDASPSGGGTVGAVARDADGRLAAATSTGGMVARAPGRVADSGLLGSGTWADDGSCAVSATGTGEFFMRRPSPTTCTPACTTAEASSPERAARRSPRWPGWAAAAAASPWAPKGGSSFASTTPDMPRGVWSEGTARIAVHGRGTLR